MILSAWTVSSTVLGTGNTRRNGNYFFKGFSVHCPMVAENSKYIIRLYFEKLVQRLNIKKVLWGKCPFFLTPSPRVNMRWSLDYQKLTDMPFDKVVE